MKTLLFLSLALFATVALAAPAQDYSEWVILHEFSEQSPGAVEFPNTTLVETSPGVFVGSYAEGIFQITSGGAFSVLANLLDAAYNIRGAGGLVPASNV